LDQFWLPRRPRSVTQHSGRVGLLTLMIQSTNRV
jgi:hypothetical protein